MKAGASSLNPFAASYVPLFEREVVPYYIDINDVTPGQELDRVNEVGWPVHQPENNNLLPHGGDVSTPKDTTAHGSEFFASTSQYSTQTTFDHEDFDMELTYLQMMFPKMAEECLSHVYNANMRDLDAAVDMLNQLEIYPDDLIDKLPDTLDIGDVPESVSVGKPSSQKLKNPTAETRASMSGSSNITSAN